MNIVLIGYRGTGKTSVGKELSERLGRPFYDADIFLEEKFAETISSMVAAHGWPFFREREKDVIAELSALEHCVIATGGGAVMDKDNVACLRRSGRLILLKADTATMIQRIQGDSVSSTQRPDLIGGDVYKETVAILKQRMPVYEKVADFSVDTTHLIVQEVVETIMQWWMASYG